MKITLFSAENCSGCIRVKKFLMDNEVDFYEINLTETPEKAMILKEMAGLMSVPITIVEKSNQKEIIVGFNKAKLSEILNSI